MGAVHVVTDSAADIPSGLAEAWGITRVPLWVTFGSESLLDGVEITPLEFLDRLSAGTVLPHTSAPNPAQFSAAYERLHQAGAQEVVSVHLSAALSATLANAAVAAETAPLPVSVVDGRSASMGTGLLALWAARAARAGWTAPAIRARLEVLKEGLTVWFSLDTLDYLERGGRIGKAQRLVGTVLDLKPVLALEGGRIVPGRRVRGQGQVARAVASAVLERVPSGRSVVIALMSLGPPGQASMETVMEFLGARLRVVDTIAAPIGPVVAVHAGPGAGGAVVLPLDPEAEAVWTGNTIVRQEEAGLR